MPLPSTAYQTGIAGAAAFPPCPLPAAGVAFFGAADFPAALAFLAAAAATLAFRAAAQRFLCAAAIRRRAAGLTIRLGPSSRANATVLSKPCGPVINARTALGRIRAAIQASYG